MATVDADEETLDFRVGRIEENPRVAFNSVIKKMGDFNLEEAAVRETRRRCSRASHRESAEPKGSACCPCACAHSEQQGDHLEKIRKKNKIK